MVVEATAELEKKEALFELIEIPEEFGPIDIRVDDHKIKAFAFTQDDYASWCFSEGSPFGKRIGQAAILANDLLGMFLIKYDASSVVGLHTEEQLWFHNPVFADETATLRGTYVDKYERRGKGYVVMEAEARGEDGRPLVRHRGIEIMRIQPGPVVGKKTADTAEERVTGEYRRDLEPVSAAREGLEPRTPIAPLVKHIHQDQVSVFSRVGEYVVNIHNNLERARQAGLPLPVVQGQQQVCWLTEMLTNFFGSSWFTSGWERVKFIHPVYPGETITMRGAVSRETNDEEHKRIELEIWVENEAGTMCTVGWASALIDPSGAANGGGW